jgi:hypothetical protein
MTSAEFPFDFDHWFVPVARLFGITPGSARVVLHDDELEARFGPWRVRTPLGNVVGAEVTGPYAVPKVIGPAHVSLSDRGLTFATNARRGVCIRFAAPVPGIGPLGLVRHPALTVTVADTAGLAELLDRAGHATGRTHAPLTVVEGGGDDDVEVAEVNLADLEAEVHDDLRSLTAAELRRRAGDRGITGVSRMSKAQLVEALERPLTEADGDAPADAGERATGAR